MRYQVLSVLGALLLSVGCGAEYTAAGPREFEPRTDWKGVLVFGSGNDSLIRGYQVIGTVEARTRHPKHAISACRKEAANHGGDAVIPTYLRGKDWICTILRRGDSGPWQARSRPPRAAPPEETAQD